MVVKNGRFGKFLACPEFPKCRNTKTIVKEVGVPCPKCGGEVIEKKSRRGKIFFGCTKFPQCDFTSWNKPTTQKCEKCGGVLYERTGRGKKLFCPDCEEAKKEEK